MCVRPLVFRWGGARVFSPLDDELPLLFRPPDRSSLEIFPRFRATCIKIRWGCLFAIRSNTRFDGGNYAASRYREAEMTYCPANINAIGPLAKFLRL
jgi:hypothetical protein